LTYFYALDIKNMLMTHSQYTVIKMLLKNGEKADVDEKHTYIFFVILTEILLFEIQPQISVQATFSCG